MTHEAKIAATRRRIQSVLDKFRQPAVMWSGGKDSMVLLHMLLQLSPGIPCIFFREPQQGRRYGFINRVIENWNLTMHEWPPYASALHHVAGGETSIVQQYQIAPGKAINMPVLFREPAAWDRPFACALESLHTPHAMFIAPWDVLFNGIKATDAHDCHAPIAAPPELIEPPGAPAFAYPLRDWTDAEIWAYTEQFDVPHQADRYHKTADGWRERDDKTGNPDYLTGCIRCLLPSHARVWCPRVKAEIPTREPETLKLDNMLPPYFRKE